MFTDELLMHYFERYMKTGDLGERTQMARFLKDEFTHRFFLLNEEWSAKIIAEIDRAQG